MDYKTLNASTATDTDISAMVGEQLKTVDDKGKLQLPEDMPEWQRRIVRSEKRQRDAQSELGRTQSTLRESEAVNKVLIDEAMGVVPSDFVLSPEELEGLNKIKFTDPDAYRLQVNELEKKAQTFQSDKLTKMQDEARSAATNSYATTNRVTVLQEFRNANPTLVITDDVLVNDVPPRFMNDLNSGKIANYHDYLVVVAAYLETGKSVNNNNPGDEHNLQSLPGGTTPGRAASNKQKEVDLSKVSL